MVATSGTQGTTEQNGAQAWANAKQLATKLSYVPSSFSTAVRALVTDHNTNGKKIRPVTKYQVARLLQGQSFKSLIYYATTSLHDDKLPKTTPWTVGQLLDLYEPFDIGTLIGSFLMNRKCRKLLTPERWAKIEEIMNEDSQIGAQLGVAVPAIGVGMGLVVNTFRWYGLAALLKANEKPWTDYKIHLKKTNAKWDLNEERKLWGCSSKEVAVFILSTLGLGVDVSDAFASAIEPTTSIDKIQNPMQLKARLALLWIDTLKKNQNQPAEVMPGEYYPLTKARERLNIKVKDVLGGAKHFLARTKEEVSKELTPQLFGELKLGADVPEELAHIFSVDEISKMEEKDFDKLVDQMDAENDGKIVPGTVSAKDLKEIEELVAE